MFILTSLQPIVAERTLLVISNEYLCLFVTPIKSYTKNVPLGNFRLRNRFPYNKFYIYNAGTLSKIRTCLGLPLFLF